MRKIIKILVSFAIVTVLIFATISIEAKAPGSMQPVITYDEVDGLPNNLVPGLEVNYNGQAADSVQVLILLTLISLLPSILVMMTSFTRLIIVFSFLRNALGLQQSPPNQVLIGLALFLTIFMMAPIFTQINDEALKPFNEGTITQDEFLEKASGPLKTFMLKQTRAEDLTMFMSLAKMERPANEDELSLTVVIPAFITSELRRAFIIGFLLFLPFLVIDMIVSSVLMSMGMVMLPPVMISLPFKILLFILVDGWSLLIKSMVSSFVL